MMESKQVAQAQSIPTRFVAISWLLVAAWAGVIFFMSSNTSSGLDEGPGLFSRVYQAAMAMQAALLGTEVDVLSPAAHFSEYAVFGALLVNALRCHMPLRRACLLAVALASCYGVTDEFHQLFVEGRMCDPVDWLTDTAGAAVGTALGWVGLRSAPAGQSPSDRPCRLRFPRR